MTQAFTLKRRVQFHETDMAGVMYFANYFRLMEEVEQEFYRSLGLSVCLEIGGRRLGFPRVNVACEYFEPARFDEALELEFRLVRLGAKSITYEVTFLRDGRRLARGTLTSVCCVESAPGAFESIAIPPPIRDALAARLDGANFQAGSGD